MKREGNGTRRFELALDACADEALSLVHGFVIAKQHLEGVEGVLGALELEVRSILVERVLLRNLEDCIDHGTHLEDGNIVRMQLGHCWALAWLYSSSVAQATLRQRS